MADRYESGKLNRRGGGVRFEVHRVITPFGEAVEEREELQGKGELWERLSSVEFERRRVELARPWNQDRNRKVALLEGMWEALGADVEKMKIVDQLGLTSKNSRRVGDATDEGKQEQSPGAEEDLKDMSDADRDIALQLRKLRDDSRSASTEQI
jgi:hypothetical protein